MLWPLPTYLSVEICDSLRCWLVGPEVEGSTVEAVVLGMFQAEMA